MPDKDFPKSKNTFTVRVYNEDLFIALNELMATNQFESRNDLLNRALKIGIEKMYIDFGKRRALAQDSPPAIPVNVKLDDIERRVKQNSITVDDLFVMMSMIETLTTTIYNLERTKAQGDPVSAELMDSGFYATLPPEYQAVKDELIKKMSRKHGEK